MTWGYSSAGRAPALHAGGQRFDPAYLHQISWLSELVDSISEFNFVLEISRTLAYLAMILTRKRPCLLFFKNRKQAEKLRDFRKKV